MGNSLIIANTIIYLLLSKLLTAYMISVISPVYGAASLLSELVERIVQALKHIQVEYEIILVEDCSPDNSWEIINTLAAKHQEVKGIRLSRNFGQHYAITAGLEASKGDWVVVMDCDLQDKPEEIPTLYKKALEGYDIVFAQRVKRLDGFLKKFFSTQFYRLLAYFTDTNQDSTIGNFGIYSRKAIDSLLAMNDKFRFFPTMIKWVGFISVSIPVEHSLRGEGKSSYTFKKLANLALNTILTFSDKPLRLVVKLGLMIVLFSIIFTFYNLFRYISGQIIEPGWTSLILSIWFLSGIIIFILGVIGMYVGKIFESVKNRPLYIIKEMVNINEP